MKRLFVSRIIIALGLAALVPSSGAAAELSVPMSMQAALIRKILYYDRSLPAGAKSAPKVVIVYVDESSAVGELRDGFQKLGVMAVAVRPTELAGAAAGAHAIYVMPGVPIDPVRAAAESKRLLTISGVPEQAERGLVAVALGRSSDDRPQILVNLTRVEAETHEFPANFLSLTKVVR